MAATLECLLSNWSSVVRDGRGWRTCSWPLPSALHASTCAFWDGPTTAFQLTLVKRWHTWCCSAVYRQKDVAGIAPRSSLAEDAKHHMWRSRHKLEVLKEHGKRPILDLDSETFLAGALYREFAKNHVNSDDISWEIHRNPSQLGRFGLLREFWWISVDFPKECHRNSHDFSKFPMQYIIR